jgi:hypothetical protein
MPLDTKKDQRERGTSYHKAKKISFLGLSKNKNELTLLNPYPSNNKKTVYISKPLVNCSFIRNGLAVHSEKQAKNVPKIFPTNEIARNKICSAALLNGHEWRKVGWREF